MTTTHGRAQRIAEAIDPRLRVVSTAPATGSFTNKARILECRTPTGSRVRLVVKFLVDKPELASRIAAVSFHAASLAREHGVPVPEPLLLDETGEVLGVPGVVSRFVQGAQVADPESPEKWAEDLACQLVQIHSIRPGERDRRFLFDGNHQTLYFTRDEYPKLMAGHPLSCDILDAVRKLQSDSRRHLPCWSIWTIGTATFCGFTVGFPLFWIGTLRDTGTLVLTWLTSG